MGRARKTSEVAAAVEVADEAIACEPEGVRLAVKLPPKQRAAIAGYRAGCRNAEAAKLADVDPSTLNRWLSHDAKFIAAHNAVILENVKAANAEAASLLPLATAAIRKQLEKGNGWLGLQYYREARSLGLLEGGPTSVKAVKEQLKLAEEAHKVELIKKQVQVQQQEQEIEKLKEQIERYNEHKAEEREDYDRYMTAWVHFEREWRREEKDQTAQAKLAERQAKVEQERGRSGEWYEAENKWKPIAADLRKQYDERQRSPAAQKQAVKHEPPVEQPSSSQPLLSPDSQRRDKPHEVDVWEGDHAEADLEIEDQEADEQDAPEHRPAYEQSPAESGKSNPDIASFDSQTVAKPKTGTIPLQNAQSVETPPDMEHAAEEPDEDG